MNGQRIKLYSAYSVLNAFRERRHVTFNWYCHRRQAPAAPHDTLIARYAELKSRGEHRALEKHADSLFTEAEIQALRAYLLERHDTELFAEPVPLPLAAGKGAPSVPWAERSDAEGTGRYMLSREDGYPLPMEVWAFYDLNGCAPTETAEKQAQARRPAVRFILEVHRALGLQLSLPEQRLDQVVAALYSAKGFVVNQQMPEPSAERPATNG
jgi:hypothetical protein